MRGHSQVHAVHLTNVNTDGTSAATRLKKNVRGSICRLYTEDLIALVKLSAEVGWPSCQDERDKNPLSVFSPNDIESETRGASVNENPARFSGKGEERKPEGSATNPSMELK